MHIHLLQLLFLLRNLYLLSVFLHIFQVTMIYDILSPSSSSSSSPSSSLPASFSFEDPFCGGGPLAFAPSSSKAGKEGEKEEEAEATSSLPPIGRFYDPRCVLFFISPFLFPLPPLLVKQILPPLSRSAATDTPLTPLQFYTIPFLRFQALPLPLA